DHADDHAHHQPAVARARDRSCLRPRRHQPDSVPLAGRVGEVHLGRRSDVHVPDRDQPGAGQRQVERGAHRGGAHDAGTVGGRDAGEQSVVVRRLGDHDVNMLLMQPFVNYNFSKGWYAVTAPILTADWTAAGGDEWTIPLCLGGGRTFRLGSLPGGDMLGDLGKLPVNTSPQAYYNALTPSFGPDWQLRFQVQFLFPR